MQLVVQYASELLTAFGLFLGAILLFRFTWNRVKDLPPEEKHLGRPLWVAVVSVFFLAVASVINFGYQGGVVGDLEVWWYITAILGSGLLMVSATMILGSRRFLALPVILIAVVAVYAYIETIYGGLLGGLTSEQVIYLIATVIFAIPTLLFSYLTYTTRRITSFALAVLSITYPLILLATSFTGPEVVASILALRLYGPALLITALVLPESKIGAELIAYSFTISSMFYFMSYLLVSTVVGDMALMLSITNIALASILAIGTAAYTITRWRQSRNPATLTIGVYFFVGGFSFLTVALNHVEFIGGLNAEYFALLLGILAPMLLNLSSIIALDWNRAALLPLLIFAAPFFSMMTGWTATPMLHPDDLPYRTMVMAISGILQSVIPLGLYGLLWRRMSKAGVPGRSRALFLMLGILFLIIGTGGGGAVSIIGSLSILTAFVIWWLGITGRADTLLKTTA